MNLTPYERHLLSKTILEHIELIKEDTLKVKELQDINEKLVGELDILDVIADDTTFKNFHLELYKKHGSVLIGNKKISNMYSIMVEDAKAYLVRLNDENASEPSGFKRVRELTEQEYQIIKIEDYKLV